MRFDFVADQEVKVSTFLRQQEISRGLLAKIKFAGGAILVNGQEQNARHILSLGDQVSVEIPSEEDLTGKLEPIEHPLNICFEDDHFLVLEKPYGVASIPSSIHSNTMANFVKAYYLNQGYENKQIHIVTRLDKDTSGLMLFAKHGYAHARLDKQLQTRSIRKQYVALVKGRGLLEEKGEIIAPIGRPADSIITRCITEEGKFAHTSYQVLQSWGDVHLVSIQLHTGRTHQIRVHFAHIGFPLLGDDLYGGSLEDGIERQALHCNRLEFVHPFTGKKTVFESDLTNDFKSVIIALENKV